MMTISPDSAESKKMAEQIRTDEKPGFWTDWRWHLKHAIRDIPTVERLLGIQFDDEERAAMEETILKFPLSVTPYYLSLIKPEEYRHDPIFLQAVPQPQELIVEAHDHCDPLSEELDSPVPCITHRYPDRVLFMVSATCAMYCRHCTRKRKVGDTDAVPIKDEILQGIEYIRKHPEIRDVLLSGGDPFMLPDDFLDWILGEIRAIPHVEIIRIGTRVPVVLPYRVTEDLVRMLKKYHPLWINVQFNHPREITSVAARALAHLADAGIPLGNQSVLLAGVNDCPWIMKRLVQRLVMNRVRPYYLYQCDLSEGLSHFQTPVAKGIEIMENLIGHTSGFAVPTYVIDAPGGGGKIPVMPTYMISCSVHKVVLRNYEGVISTYEEPAAYDRITCDGNCRDCRLQLPDLDIDETRLVGIARLLADYDDTISLVPEDTERMERRSD